MTVNQLAEFIAEHLEKQDDDSFIGSIDTTSGVLTLGYDGRINLTKLAEAILGALSSPPAAH